MFFKLVTKLIRLSDLFPQPHSKGKRITDYKGASESTTIHFVQQLLSHTVSNTLNIYIWVQFD